MTAEFGTKEYVEDIAREKNNTSRITPEGKELGKRLAELADEGVECLKKDDEQPDTRCASCAFRKDTVPNGCPVTQLDAFKSVFSKDTMFACHCVNEGGEMRSCHGWVAAKVAKRRRGLEDIELDTGGKDG